VLFHPSVLIEEAVAGFAVNGYARGREGKVYSHWFDSISCWRVIILTRAALRVAQTPLQYSHDHMHVSFDTVNLRTRQVTDKVAPRKLLLELMK
jgi:hypothetical protein